MPSIAPTEITSAMEPEEVDNFFSTGVVILNYTLASGESTQWIVLTGIRSVILIANQAVRWIVADDAASPMNRYLARTDTNSDEMPWAADATTSEAGFIHGDVMPDRVLVNNGTGSTATVQVRMVRG